MISGIFFDIVLTGDFMKEKRVLLKLSGEALKNNKDGIIDIEYIGSICKKIKKLWSLDYEISIVIGGGNIWRGRDNLYIDSTLSDKIGILSTTINGMILHSVFKKLDINSVLLNAFDIENIASKSTEKEIKNAIKNKDIIIFSGGTGHVGCSTDTAAALRIIDIDSDILIKLTNVDGVYDKDPKKYKDAVKFEMLTYDEVIEKNLKVMDLNSIVLCKNNKKKILVLDIKELENLDQILKENNKGTLIQ